MNLLDSLKYLKLLVIVSQWAVIHHLLMSIILIIIIGIIGLYWQIKVESVQSDQDYKFYLLNHTIFYTYKNTVKYKLKKT
jgi:hypothetical protein